MHCKAPGEEESFFLHIQAKMPKLSRIRISIHALILKTHMHQPASGGPFGDVVKAHYFELSVFHMCYLGRSNWSDIDL